MGAWKRFCQLRGTWVQCHWSRVTWSVPGHGVCILEGAVFGSEWVTYWTVNLQWSRYWTIKSLFRFIYNYIYISSKGHHYHTWWQTLISSTEALFNIHFGFCSIINVHTFYYKLILEENRSRPILSHAFITWICKWLILVECVKMWCRLKNSFFSFTVITKLI